VGLRPLVCFATYWYYTTVSAYKYTPIQTKLQSHHVAIRRHRSKAFDRLLRKHHLIAVSLEKQSRGESSLSLTAFFAPCETICVNRPVSLE
jgi:hypothetical protein